MRAMSDEGSTGLGLSLPRPEDDGAADGLAGRAVPAIALESTTGERTDLASIAAAVGFADHSHMTRSIVAQFGTTPSRLRELLREPLVAPALRSVTTD